MKDIAEILKKKQLNRDFRNSYEFQAYGNRLAEEMGEPNRRGMYLKLAKTVDRSILEQAREYVMGQEHISTKGKLFMWKVKQLREKKKEEEKETKK